MTDARGTDHQAIHRAMVSRLQSETVAVRRSLPVHLRLMLWLLLDAVLLAWIGVHAERDLAPRLAHPAYIVELVFFLVAATLFAAAGLSSVIPGRSKSRVSINLGLLLMLAAVTAIAATQTFASSLTLDRFAQIGVNCALGTTVWAIIPWIVLWWMCRRAAPLEGARSGILIGAGAVCFSAVAMRIACPLDEPAHLLIWHVLPGVLLAGIATIVGARWLHFSRVRRQFPGG